MKELFYIVDELWLSIVLLVVFLLLQHFLGHRYTLSSIRRLRHLFPDVFTVEASDIPQIAYSESHPLYQEICRKINSYIIKNNESIELGEIKDIVNRLLNKEYESATAKLSVPMLWGLVGTYLGVGLGLGMFAFEIMAGEGQLSENGPIIRFIGGVVVAMGTSATGLMMTMWGNRNAATLEKELEDGKDRLFAFLQTEIIPDLPTTLAQTLQEGLHKPIHELGEVVGSLSQRLKDTFERVTNGFGEHLTQNLKRLDKTIGQICEATTLQERALKKQEELINLIGGGKFSLLLEQIVSTVNHAEESATKFKTNGEEFLQLQQQSSQIQHALIEAQEGSLQMIQGMDQATIASTERFCTLIKEPGLLFQHIDRTLKEFECFRGFVERFVAAEERDKMQYVERIDKQLRTIGEADSIISQYMNTVEKDLSQMLDKQQQLLKESILSFGNSWQNFFTRASVDSDAAPLLYPNQIQQLIEQQDRILRGLESIMGGLQDRAYHSKPHDKKDDRRGWISKLFKRTRS